MLQVSDIAVVDYRSGRPVALTGPLSFDVAEGEIFGLVGESGSGKTMCGLALIRLVPSTARVSGRAMLEGKDLVAASEREMRRIRGADIGMIFQEPISALNPVFTLETQLIAAIKAHQKLTKSKARLKAIELLRLVGIPDPDSRLKFYPHQLSGGLAQRAMIAMALASGAKFLIADEPTTSLDVTIQEQIVQLIERLARESGISVLFISHDLGVVARLCKRIAVLYSGEIVEIGATDNCSVTRNIPTRRDCCAARRISIKSALYAAAFRERHRSLVHGQPDAGFRAGAPLRSTFARHRRRWKNARPATASDAVVRKCCGVKTHDRAVAGSRSHRDLSIAQSRHFDRDCGRFARHS